MSKVKTFIILFSALLISSCSTLSWKASSAFEERSPASSYNDLPFLTKEEVSSHNIEACLIPEKLGPGPFSRTYYEAKCSNGVTYRFRDKEKRRSYRLKQLKSEIETLGGKVIFSRIESTGRYQYIISFNESSSHYCFGYQTPHIITPNPKDSYKQVIKYRANFTCSNQEDIISVNKMMALDELESYLGNTYNMSLLSYSTSRSYIDIIDFNLETVYKIQR